MTDTTTDSGQRPDSDLLDLAAAYALDAIDDRERTTIVSTLSDASPEVRREFHDRIRRHRETLASYSSTTAETAPKRLRETILQSIAEDGAMDSDFITARPIEDPLSLESARRRRSRLTQTLAAAAAAAVLVAGGVVIGHQFTGTPAAPPASEVFTAADVRTSAVDVAGGVATTVYSHDANAAVLVMNDVAPPQPDTVYQLWLLGPDRTPTPVGMMSSDQVSLSTRAVVNGIDESTALGISIEPSGGSSQPSAIVARMSLT